MKRIAIGIPYVDFEIRGQYKRKEQQTVALKVLKELPSWVYPVVISYIGATKHEELKILNIPQLNLLNRNSQNTIFNTRPLPYIKDYFLILEKIDCDIIGFINSDILMPEQTIDRLEEDYESFVFSRTDISDISVNNFMKGEIKPIYGGNTHAGADGFFFNISWWKKNKRLFPNDLVLAETEWDTCYRIIAKNNSKCLNERLLYHVYHDQEWNLTTNGAKNNIRIWERVRDDYRGGVL